MQAGISLSRFVHICDKSPYVLPDATVASLFGVLEQFCEYGALAGLPTKPKRHLLMHLVERSHYHGNPASYAVWMDESLNRTLANISRSAHRSVWELRVLSHYERFEASRPSKAARR